MRSRAVSLIYSLPIYSASYSGVKDSMRMRKNRRRMKIAVRRFFLALGFCAIIRDGGDEGCSRISSSSKTARSRYK